MDEMTISISDLLGVLVRKGKPILLLGVLFALLLGAYKGISVYRGSGEADSSARSGYEAQIEAQEKVIAAASESAQKVQEYIDGSLWMKISPYDKYESTIQLMIAGVDERDADMTFAVTQTPLNYLLGRISAQYMTLYDAVDLASLPGVPEGVEDKYLREVISLQSMTLSAKDTTPSGVITITAAGSDAQSAKALANAVYDWMQSVAPTAAQNTYAHTLEKFGEDFKSRIDEEMLTAQNERYEMIAEYDEIIVKAQEQLAEAEGALKKLDAPNASFSDVAKMALIGGVVGVFLACAWYCCKALFGAGLMSSSHGEQMLKVPFIGSLAPRKGILCRISDVLCGERVWKDERQASGYIAETLKLRAEGKRLLLCSSLPLSDYAETVKTLQGALAASGTVTCAGDFLHDPDALSQLSACDVVVLVESVDKTSLHSAEKILAFAKECEKPVAGFVTI